MPSARAQYLKMIETMASNSWDVTALIEWMADPSRKPAIVSFTEGPARQVAYAFERAMKGEMETAACVEPMQLRPTERCPRCGFTQVIMEN